MKKSFILLAVLASSITATAQNIDFDMSGRTTSEVTTDGYNSWMVPQAADDSKTAGGVTLKVEASRNANVLRSQWSKNDVKSMGLRLTGDGIASYVNDNGNTPNQTNLVMGIKFTITGLSAGKHTIQAYHNGVNGYTGLAPIDIYVNGIKVVDDLEQSTNAQSVSAAAVSYITVDVSEGKDVVIEYVSDPKNGVTYGSSLVYVNALIMNQINTQTQAQDPNPANKDYHADADRGNITLKWKPSRESVRQKVYFGTSADDMALVSTQTDTTYTVSDLNDLTTYYWRVDEVDNQGQTVTSPAWSFRPRHLAFPGAEGYGKYAIGGRGGTVYHVTTLADNGDDDNPTAGSLRYGIKKISGPRTIVFDISGTIDLKNRLTCSDSCVTIAGQTAPGHGIMLRTCPFGTASDGIIRFIRMRLGHKKLLADGIIPGGQMSNYPDYGDDTDKTDSTTMHGLDGMGMAGNDNSIMDHCSISWTIDEAFSSRNSKNITLQHTLISEALNDAGHPNYSKGTEHGYAATIGGGEMSSELKAGSYHHNLLAHCEGRNWSISGGLDGAGTYDGHHDIFNNVVYNWGNRATDGGSHEINFVNNFYKMGEATTQSKLLRLQLEGTGNGTQSAYVNGNIRQEKNNGSLTGDEEGNTYQYELSHEQNISWIPFVDKPFFESLATIETAKAAYKNVLSDVGCNDPFFDPHDQRMISETLQGTYTVVGSRTGKKGLPDSENDANCEGFDGLQMTEERRPADFDTDGDGMPDWWEKATGMTDSNADDNNDGYTNLEEYLNWMAQPHFSSLDNINLKTYFAGYDHNPSFTISNTTGNIKADINGNTLQLATDTNSNDNLGTVTVKATDSDDWGSLERTFNFAVSSATGITSVQKKQQKDNQPEYIYDLCGRIIGYGNPQNRNVSRGVYIYQGKKFIKSK